MAVLTVKSGDPVVNLAGEMLWVRGQGDHGTEGEPRVIGDVSDAEKLALVETHQKQVVVDLANQRKLNVAVDEVKVTEEASKHTV